MTDTKNAVPSPAERPLSPHLQIYRWQLTMTMSISHRAAGLAMAVGLAMVVWMFAAAASGPEAYGHFSAFAASPLGRLMIFGWSLAFCYHICNGVRHLLWDMGYLFKIENAYRAGYTALACAAALCALIWALALGG
jgi:succinate dehydrogenase / fumarate reductase cytochrome b subunit